MEASKRISIRRAVGNCPWREHQIHTTTKPSILTDLELQDIAVQISRNGYRPLPSRGITKNFFRCPDCHAVWLARSMFESVEEDQVCGVYDQVFIWTPYPWMEGER
jgi:hypothetical protein